MRAPDSAEIHRLLLVLALVLAPHGLHLPIWITASVAALLAWRAACEQFRWRLPGGVVRAVLTVSAFAAVWLTYGRSSGQAAGTALLCLMIGLKLTELGDRRSIRVILLLLYFTLFTHFLRDQAMWTVLWMLASVLLITALLIDGQRVHRAGWRADLRLSARVLLLGLPVMLLLWVLFPRIPGPLWGAPVESSSAQTGISESMAPGDIAELIRSDAVAFRVDFTGDAPPNAQRYWRGPVLWHSDGRRWQIDAVRGRTPSRPDRKDSGAVVIPTSGSEVIDYAITLEPHRHDYVFALDYALASTLPAPLAQTQEAIVVADEPFGSRRRYSLRAYPDARLGGSRLDAQQRARALQLPEGTNPRTRALAREWRGRTSSTRALVEQALAFYRDQGFWYTLSPPALGNNSVDEFLFDTQRGFCEHFAGSFTTLMRAAGVPARVVLGYQGGTASTVGDYTIVRQSDAHAWTEVWIDGTGWVRVDPTATVAPDRIEMNLQSALAERGEQLPMSWTRQLRIGQWANAYWDFANMQWNRWILAYGPELQQALLSRIGLGDWQRMLLALTALMLITMGIIALLTLRATLTRHPSDAVALEWQRICARLARSGFAARAGEGPRDYARRAAAQLEGATLRAFNDAADAYLRARYLPHDTATAEVLLQRLRDGRRRMPLWMPVLHVRERLNARQRDDTPA